MGCVSRGGDRKEGVGDEDGPDYTPYRAASLSWMMGGNEVTWRCHPFTSWFRNPVKSCWNMALSSGEGLFHRTMALQNHIRLYRHGDRISP